MKYLLRLTYDYSKTITDKDKTTTCRDDLDPLLLQCTRLIRNDEKVGIEHVEELLLYAEKEPGYLIWAIQHGLTFPLIGLYKSKQPIDLNLLEAIKEESGVTLVKYTRTPNETKTVSEKKFGQYRLYGYSVPVAKLSYSGREYSIDVVTLTWIIRYTCIDIAPITMATARNYTRGSHARFFSRWIELVRSSCERSKNDIKRLERELKQKSRGTKTIKDTKIANYAKPKPIINRTVVGTPMMNQIVSPHFDINRLDISLK